MCGQCVQRLLSSRLHHFTSKLRVALWLGGGFFVALRFLRLAGWRRSVCLEILPLGLGLCPRLRERTCEHTHTHTHTHTPQSAVLILSRVETYGCVKQHTHTHATPLSTRAREDIEANAHTHTDTDTRMKPTLTFHHALGPPVVPVGICMGIVIPGSLEWRRISFMHSMLLNSLKRPSTARSKAVF